VKYAFMLAHRAEFRITIMARVFEVSRSGFYEWHAASARRHARREADAAFDAQVRTLFFQFKQKYGAPRLANELKSLGKPADKKTVAASLRRQGLRARAARKFKATTNSKHNLPVSPNLLEQDFSASRPNQKWVGDITYLWTDEGWMYLATVIDLYSRKVVGWAMSDRMTAKLVCDALMMALWRRKMPKAVIFHSDRGSQYCSREFQRLIRRHKLRSSMSAKGNCYDNAVAESFFHSLKVEAIHGERLPTRGEMRATVFEYIEVDYNRVRQHSANGYLSPEAFEAKRAA
jgi:transposase InsO family protein